MLRRLFFALFNRTVLIVLGLVALMLAIWYIGPLFAFADWRPLEPIPARIWTIGCLLALVLLRLLVAFWRHKRMNALLLQTLVGLRGTEPAPSASDAALLELQGNFEQALLKLKKLRFGSQDQGWWASLRQKYVYQIPWYVFIGAPGSGKTTALVNSGLRFPLADELGRESIRGVGGTRNCDWWFSDETVLLDTAGRYTTHESDAAADKSEWDGFLKLLKRFRPRQPLNGAILTLSVQDLLGANEEERKRHAARLRARLNELHESLGIAFPVYVLITKADLLGGFNEYFANLSKEERAQVWGVTLPYRPDSEQDSQAIGKQLEQEFELLARRLFDGLPELMLNEHDTARRARAYALPQHFTNLTPLLGQVLQDVFADNRFAPTAMLRGVYFTSGTQEGTPFDRVLGVLGRSLGFDARVALQSAPGTGKSYFLQDLLRKVIFPEAHLAGRNRRAERRERILSLLGHSAVVLLLLGSLAAWALSFKNNTQYIDLVDLRTEKLGGRLNNLMQSEGGSLLELAPLLDQLNSLADGPDFPVDDPRLNYTYGLYQGGKLGAVAQTSYRVALEQALLPKVVQRLEDLLRNTPQDNQELAYEVLKAYLMFNQPEHFDADALEAFIQMEWERSLPPSMSRNQRDQLFAHLHRLLKDQPVTSPFPLDEALVASKREQLAAFSLAQRAYSRLKLRLLDGSLADFNLAEAGGPQSSLVFVRASGKPLTQGIPGLFTYNGYHKVFLPETQAILGRLETEEGWVLGRVAQPVTQQVEGLLEGATQRDIKRLYLHEYVRLWEEYLADIRLIDSQSMSQNMEKARILSAPDSPIAQFLRSVARETTLLRVEKVPDTQSLAGQAANKVRSAASDLDRVFGPSELTRRPSQVEQLERIVDDRFEPLRRLVTADGGAAPLQAALRLFNEMYMNLSSTDVALRTGTVNIPQNDTLNRIRAEAAYLPVPLRSMLEGMVDSSSSQTEGTVRRSLGGELDSSVGTFCRKAISGRYPFKRSSSQDVTLADFSQLFAPDAMFDQFFREHLASMTDMSGATWILRQSGGVQIPLTSFQRAARIRDLFFPGGARTPQLSMDVRVLEMDASITSLTIDFDGQLFRYAHGPQLSQKINWPGPRGSNQLRLELGSSNAPSVFLNKNGPWAPMRLFDEGDSRYPAGPEKFISTLMLQGKKVVLEVTASSVRNPFRVGELSSFSCPSRI
ncbi:MAG: type VI secretion system membrane subunit TssM [Pseudomonas sp.]|uniref:type VI secretion system membrane subunit TssM n=1 Tax=Pseudomonas sp. TaxID=306 RepID=UPI0033954948